MDHELAARLSRPGPKRLLALDGGGIRGLLTLGYLKSLESQFRQRYASPGLRLCDYFDVIGGTSTGALIATLLALGRSVSEIETLYVDLANQAFQLNHHWGFGALGRALGSRFEARNLEQILRNALGDVRLDSEQFRSGLMIVAKRADTASVWPVVNFPAAKYFLDRERPDGSLARGNRHLPVWEILRAATAAPTYFQPKHIDDVAIRQPALFLDGAVSAHNNPALLLLMATTLQGFGLDWKLNPERLLLCSVGTGALERTAEVAALSRFNNLDWVQLLIPQLIGDSMELVETILQWMSAGPTHRQIDRQIGLVQPKLGARDGLIHYLRYNVRLDAESLQALGAPLDGAEIQRLADMGDIAMIPQLRRIAGQLGAQVVAAHFPRDFDPT